jgi:hypothetical protein
MFGVNAGITVLAGFSPFAGHMASFLGIRTVLAKMYTVSIRDVNKSLPCGLARKNEHPCASLEQGDLSGQLQGWII